MRGKIMGRVWGWESCLVATGSETPRGCLVQVHSLELALAGAGFHVHPPGPSSCTQLSAVHRAPPPSAHLRQSTAGTLLVCPHQLVPTPANGRAHARPSGGELLRREGAVHPPVFAEHLLCTRHRELWDPARGDSLGACPHGAGLVRGTDDVDGGQLTNTLVTDAAARWGLSSSERAGC